MVSAADNLLARLEGVRQSGPGRWMARCPAHEDRSPSLSVRELEDGRVLVHCFSGCAAADVVAAVGLSLADLFADRLDHRVAPTRDRRHIHAAREALKASGDDALLVALAGENIVAGIPLSDEDRVLVADAAARLRKARKVAA